MWSSLFRLVPLLAGVFLALPGWAAPAGAERPLPAGMATALAQAKVPRDAVAFLVQPLDEGAPRLAHRVDVAMNPASVMKMVTTLAALDRLGPDYTWKTRFYADGPVSGGTLNGNLYIQGGGDPKLVLERVDAAFKALQAQGVQHVRGDMVLDNAIFELPAHDPAAFDNEPLRPYNVAPDGLLVNFKALILRFVPQADGSALVQSEPPLAGVAVPARVPLLAGQACGDWRAALQADFSDPSAVRLAGHYPARCGERDWAVAYPEPGSYAQRALQALFEAAGGRLDGSARNGRTPTQARLLLESPSLPLGEVIADINKRSNNVMAQQLVLTLGAQRHLPARMADGREAIARWWAGFVGTGQPAPVLENGAGLSRDERITTAALAQMLQRASQLAAAPVYLQSLSLAGVDGTTERMRERGLHSVVGRAWLKTGSLRDVASVAGYAQGRSGQRYVVIGMVNHPNAAAARPVLDALLQWTVDDER
ncbi:D-alanyl-D-alanine carboxypeptidase/D-alanyl-D-alanine endopeptidase [Pseudorhodoferax sp.]|uniref:D-alanyl-D-alanine carboxypeptidase/D-alanyl-D-alanine endopeptidase n=1 Tax=Pseudorhodoferax sp. TaxID=1993553 RepID=UPI002DD63CBC|nr:D-alanyl-D-alanine carboxypeptidase/D-alanyl-D-alanine-endopeptidase [Pseudorhodoferax sp.]